MCAHAAQKEQLRNRTEPAHPDTHNYCHQNSAPPTHQAVPPHAGSRPPPPPARQQHLLPPFPTPFPNPPPVSTQFTCSSHTYICYTQTGNTQPTDSPARSQSRGKAPPPTQSQHAMYTSCLPPTSPTPANKDQPCSDIHQRNRCRVRLACGVAIHGIGHPSPTHQKPCQLLPITAACLGGLLSTARHPAADQTLSHVTLHTHNMRQ